LSCDQPINYTDNTDDCDDSDSTVYQYYGGASDVCAGIDCSDIVDLGFAQGDGTYWIDPDGNGAYQVYCDMTTDGGGWTLVAKIEDDSNSAWTYHEPKWVNAGEIFSETDFTLISGEAKYTSFDEVSFLEMRIQDPINGNDIILADAGSSVSQFLNQQNNEAATLSSMTITDSADIGYIGFTTQSSICESHVVSLLAQDQFFRYNSEGVYYANSGTATGNARIGLWGSGSNSHIWSWTSDCAMGLGLTTNGYQGSSATGSSFGRISLLWVR